MPGMAMEALDRMVLPLRLARWMMVLAPAFLAYAILFYLFIGLVYVAARPELIARMFFRGIDLVPAYLDYASERIWKEIRDEFSGRFR